MKYGAALIAFAVAFFIQTACYSFIDIHGAAPNLLLCLVIVTTFMYDTGYSGIVYGVVFGLLYDIYAGYYPGVSSLCFLVIGICVLIIKEFLNKEHFGTILIVTAAAVLAFDVLYWMIYRAMGSVYSFGHMLAAQPPTIAYDLVVIAVAYYVLIGRVIKFRGDRQFR